MRIYSRGDPNVTSDRAAALRQNDVTMISVANRVIVIGYQSVITVWRVKTESRRVESSAFYRSTTQKCKPKFSTVRSTVGQDFDAKPRNPAQRTTKAEDELSSVSSDMQAVKRCAAR